MAPGITAPLPIELTVEDWEGFDLVLKVGAVPADGDRAGRLLCKELTLRQRDDGPPVTSDALRAVPVATLMRSAGLGALLASQPHSGGGVEMFPLVLDSETVDRVRALGPVRDSLQEVARVYRLALVLGDPPTRAVEATFGLPRSTAGRWVGLAREQGFLGVAEGPGKAGG